MSRLERWSRLKRNVPQEADTPSPRSESVDEASTEQHAALRNSADPEHNASEALQTPEQATEQTPEPGSLDHTLPDPDTLAAGSDFSAFMLPGVSGALRRRALKRLWATGNYNVRDGLDDYDADYHKLLKPMASELASKLRRWTHEVEKVEEVEKTEVETTEQAVDTQLNDTQTVSHTQPIRQNNDETAPCTTSDSVIQNDPLDDQSDCVSNPATKTC